MQFELGIFLFELLILIGSIKLLFPLLILSKNKDISVADFLNVCALLIGALVTGGCLISFGIEHKIGLIPTLVSLMALGGSFLFYKLKKNDVHTVLVTLLFCSIGAFLLPTNTPVQNLAPVEILSKIAAVCGWTIFIFMMQKLDRIPFFSFSAFSSLFIIISFMSSYFFLFFSPIFSLLCFSALGLSGLSALLLKKQNVMWFGPTLCFFLSYIAGYFGVYTSALGFGEILPVFIAFELLEIILAFSINYIKEKKFLPLTTPFLVERAYASGKNVAKAVKKMFWTCFFFAGLGFVFIYVGKKVPHLNSTDGLFAILIVTGILLLNTYIVFSSWGKEKKEFKNLFKDIKKELNNLSEETKKIKKQIKK